MHVTELDLSPATLACLKAADIHLIDQLLEYGSGDLIQHPKFSKGLELYEIICELHRHGLTFPDTVGTFRPSASAKCSDCGR